MIALESAIRAYISKVVQCYLAKSHGNPTIVDVCFKTNNLDERIEMTLPCETVTKEIAGLCEDLTILFKSKRPVKAFVSEEYYEALTVVIYDPREIFERRVFPSTRGYKLTIIILFLIILFLLFK